MLNNFTYAHASIKTMSYELNRTFMAEALILAQEL